MSFTFSVSIPRLLSSVGISASQLAPKGDSGNDIEEVASSIFQKYRQEGLSLNKDRLDIKSFPPRIAKKVKELIQKDLEQKEKLGEFIQETRNVPVEQYYSQAMRLFRNGEDLRGYEGSNFMSSLCEYAFQNENWSDVSILYAEV